MSQFIEDIFQGQDFSGNFTTNPEQLSTKSLLGFMAWWDSVTGADENTKIILEVSNVSEASHPSWQTAAEWYINITNGTAKDGLRGLGIVEFRFFRFRFEGALTGGTVEGNIHVKSIDTF